MANTTHFARKLPQVEKHEKPHSLHQDYQYVMQLQLCCFLSPKDQDHIYQWSMDVHVIGKQTKCTISDCATCVPLPHAQLPLLVSIHKKTAKPPLPLTISHYQECYRHGTMHYLPSE